MVNYMFPKRAAPLLQQSDFCCTFAGCMVKRMKTYLGLFLLGLLALSGCRPDTVCRKDTGVALGVSVRWLFTDTLGNSTWQTAFDSITVQGVGNDSVLYDNGKNLSSLWLPMRADTSVTAYLLRWHGEEDTLYIRHDNTRHFISQACGCMVYHTLDTVWHRGSAIDSVTVVNSLVESDEQENIQLTMRNS